ncbi:MAG: hypothetical protein AB7V27_12355 [Candidatus Binatia bacterium]
MLAWTAALLSRALAEAPPASAFSPWFSERDVEVRIARATDGWPWIQAVGIVEEAADTLAARLTDWAAYPALFKPALRHVAVLEQRPGHARLHMVWRVPFPFRDRDGIVRYRAARKPHGTWHIDWRDDVRPGDPATGVRIAAIEGSTVIEPITVARSRVTYRYLGDLGGDFGTHLNERAWRAESLHYFKSLRTAAPAEPRPENEPAARRAPHRVSTVRGAVESGSGK